LRRRVGPRRYHMARCSSTWRSAASVSKEENGYSRELAGGLMNGSGKNARVGIPPQLLLAVWQITCGPRESAQTAERRKQDSMSALPSSAYREVHAGLQRVSGPRTPRVGVWAGGVDGKLTGICSLSGLSRRPVWPRRSTLMGLRCRGVLPPSHGDLGRRRSWLTGPARGISRRYQANARSYQMSPCPISSDAINSLQPDAGRAPAFLK